MESCLYLNSDVPGWGVDHPNQEYIKTTNYNLNYNIRIYRDFLYIIVINVLVWHFGNFLDDQSSIQARPNLIEDGIWALSLSEMGGYYLRNTPT